MSVRSSMNWSPLPPSFFCWLLLAVVDARAGEFATGPWHGWITSRAGHVVFDLFIESTAEGLSASIRNGTDVVPIQGARWESEELVLEFLDYDASIRAEVSDDGQRLDGKWFRRFGSASTPLPFHAVAGEQPRFEIDAVQKEISGTIEGRWQMEMDRDVHSSVGVFETHGDGTASGTVLTSIGDKRMMYGAHRGDRLILSRFDGFHTFLLDVRLQPDGSLEGRFGEAGVYVTNVRGVKDADARLPDPFGHFEVSGPVELGDSRFVDLDKKRCSIEDVAHGAKVILIEITGTWCPNCHDATKFLVPFYERYRDRGLAVMGLAFEMTADVDRNLRFLRRYRDKYAVPYPMVLGFGGASKGPAEVFPTIQGQYSFPTIILLDDQGSVLAAHTGFTGPASPLDYAALQEQFDSLLEKLLPASGSGR